MNRNDLRQARAWWSDDSHFAPLLPRHIAERLRAPLYAGAIVLAIVVLAPLLHVQVVWLNTAPLVAILVLLALVFGERDAGDAGDVAQLPATGETIRLVRHE